MKTRAVLSLGLSALVLGGTMVGCAGGKGGVASASSHEAGTANKLAAANAANAGKALAKADAVAAIGFAETAVAMSPTQATYRVLLGQSYLKAGRFTSARQAFADALALAPDNGKAALNLALAQTATGDWDGARKTLDINAQSIPATDRGLAMALAGDPAGAVGVLTEAARSPDATAKTRQNLALALALAGQWQMARVVAAADISPDQVDKRMTEWAAFAQPASASDQVSALLGVNSVEDAGQPVALALNAPVATPATTPADPAPVALAEASPAPFTMANPSPAPFPGRVETASVADPAPVVEPAPAMVRVVVQDVPPPTIRASVARMKVALARASVPTKAIPAVLRAPAKGGFYVQLGAFESAGVAKDAWGRATRRYAGFARQSPTGMSFTTKGSNFYRLSVGGFVRADADALCRGYRARGGTCFVRAGAGDQMAAWVRNTGVQMASR